MPWNFKRQSEDYSAFLPGSPLEGMPKDEIPSVTLEEVEREKEHTSNPIVAKEIAMGQKVADAEAPTSAMKSAAAGTSWDLGRNYPDDNANLEGQTSGQNNLTSVVDLSAENKSSEDFPHFKGETTEHESIRSVNQVETGETPQPSITDPDWNKYGSASYGDFFVKASYMIYGLKKDNVSFLEAEKIISLAFAKDCAIRPWCKKAIGSFTASAFGPAKRINRELFDIFPVAVKDLDEAKAAGLGIKDAINKTLAVNSGWVKVYGHDMQELVYKAANYVYGSKMYDGHMVPGDRITVYASGRDMAIVLDQTADTEYVVAWANKIPSRLTVNPFEVIIHAGFVPNQPPLYMKQTSLRIVAADVTTFNPDSKEMRQLKTDDSTKQALEAAGEVKKPDGTTEKILKVDSNG